MIFHQIRVKPDCRMVPHYARLFQIALRGEGEWEILLGEFFLSEGGNQRAFSKLKTIFRKYWKSIKTIHMTCTYRVQSSNKNATEAMTTVRN